MKHAILPQHHEPHHGSQTATVRFSTQYIGSLIHDLCR
jgi:hypothetical protein